MKDSLVGIQASDYANVDAAWENFRNLKLFQEKAHPLMRKAT